MHNGNAPPVADDVFPLANTPAGDNFFLNNASSVLPANIRVAAEIYDFKVDEPLR
jgi:hypothetical protein